MTVQELKDYYEGQIKWYTEQIAWHRHQLEWCAKNTARELKRSKELTEHIWNRGVITKSEMVIWPADGSYRNDEWKKADKERRSHYRQIKKHEHCIKDYKKKLAELK